MRRRLPALLPGALLLLPATVLVLAGGTPSVIPALTPLETTAASGHAVEIRGLSFIPEELTIAPGDTVTWTNFDDDRHTLKGGSMNGPEMKMGDRFSFRFDHPARVSYTCTVHTYMRGTVTVGDGAGAHGGPGRAEPEPPAPTTTTTEGSHLVPILPVREPAR